MKCTTQTHRIAVVGPVKSGVTSLRAALTELGYNPIPERPVYHAWFKTWNIARMMTAAQEFDCLLDLPWALMFTQIHLSYPATRFIMTDRAADAIARSEWRWKQKQRVNWPKGEPGKAWLRKRIADINRLKKNIREYFRKQKIDILEWDCERHGWPELCAFLGCAKPDKPFPHLNKTRP